MLGIDDDVHRNLWENAELDQQSKHFSRARCRIYILISDRYPLDVSLLLFLHDMNYSLGENNFSHFKYISPLLIVHLIIKHQHLVPGESMKIEWLTFHNDESNILTTQRNTQRVKQI